jgi:hypothetical protein
MHGTPEKKKTMIVTMNAVKKKLYLDDDVTVKAGNSF